MKNVYEPDNDDIYEWLTYKSNCWPAGDWDYYVLNGKNDDLIFDMANDRQCREKIFFLHALYYLVGDYYISGMVDHTKHERITRLISKVGSDCCPNVIKWKGNALNLLSNKKEFDIEYWLHHMF